MHHREYHRPSSSGHLIHRVMPGSRLHLWHPGQPLREEDVQVAGREVWILHPLGERAPTASAPEAVQIVLLDGSWSEASAMTKKVGGWGRRVRLAMTGQTRYWLRDQAAVDRFSTIEAFIHVLELFDLKGAAAQLRGSMELHVYANLRMRGHKDLAAGFLQSSPAKAALLAWLAEGERARRA